MEGARPSTQTETNMDLDQQRSGQSSLPPIEDKKRSQQEKAEIRAAKEAQECEQIAAMSLEQKKKLLDSFNALDQYEKGNFLDA